MCTVSFISSRFGLQIKWNVLSPNLGRQKSRRARGKRTIGRTAFSPRGRQNVDGELGGATRLRRECRGENVAARSGTGRRPRIRDLEGHELTIVLAGVYFLRIKRLQTLQKAGRDRTETQPHTVRRQTSLPRKHDGAVHSPLKPAQGRPVHARRRSLSVNGVYGAVIEAQRARRGDCAASDPGALTLTRGRARDPGRPRALP